jgi:hypothetical protein
VGRRGIPTIRQAGQSGGLVDDQEGVI